VVAVVVAVVDPNLAPRKWSISTHHTRSCPILSTASAGAKRYPITRPSGKCTSAAFASSSSSLPPAASAALDPFDHLSPPHFITQPSHALALTLCVGVHVCVCVCVWKSLPLSLSLALSLPPSLSTRHPPLHTWHRKLFTCDATFPFKLFRSVFYV